MSQANDLLGFEDKKLSDLEHWGIKGMSWGIQNGPPYPLNKETSAEIKKGNNPKTMTDQELREKINRLNMEKQYKELTHPYATEGKRFLKENSKQLLSTLFKTTVTAGALAGAAIFMKKFFPKVNFNISEKLIQQVAKAVAKEDK